MEEKIDVKFSKKGDLLLSIAWRRYDNLLSGEARLESKLNMLLIANGLLIPFFSIVFQSGKNIYPFLIMSILPILSIIVIIIIISDSRGIATPNFKNFVTEIDSHDDFLIKARLAISVDHFCDKIEETAERKAKYYSILLMIFGLTFGLFIGASANLFGNLFLILGF